MRSNNSILLGKQHEIGQHPNRSRITIRGITGENARATLPSRCLPFRTFATKMLTNIYTAMFQLPSDSLERNKLEWTLPVTHDTAAADGAAGSRVGRPTHMPTEPTPKHDIAYPSHHRICRPQQGTLGVLELRLFLALTEGR